MKANLSQTKLKQLTVVELKDVLNANAVKFHKRGIRKDELCKIVAASGKTKNKIVFQVETLLGRKKNRGKSTTKTVPKKAVKKVVKKATSKPKTRAASKAISKTKVASTKKQDTTANLGLSKENIEAQKALINLTSHVEESPLIDKLTRCKGKVRKSLTKQFNSAYSDILNSDVRFLRSAFKEGGAHNRPFTSTKKTIKHRLSTEISSVEGCSSCSVNCKLIGCILGGAALVGGIGYLLCINDPALAAYVRQLAINLRDKASPYLPELNPGVIGVSALLYCVVLILIFLYYQRKQEFINLAKVIKEEIKDDCLKNNISSFSSIELAGNYASKHNVSESHFNSTLLRYIEGLLELDEDFSSRRNNTVTVWTMA